MQRAAREVRNAIIETILKSSVRSRLSLTLKKIKIKNTKNTKNAKNAKNAKKCKFLTSVDIRQPYSSDWHTTADCAYEREEDERGRWQGEGECVLLR
jgi:hypothetical protein